MLGELLLLPCGRRVDHRVAVRRLLGAAVRGLARPDEPRLDAELAQLQRLVRLELDVRTGDEREALAAGVLEQVGGQLVEELALDPLQPRAVLRREPHGVLVGDVGA